MNSVGVERQKALARGDSVVLLEDLPKGTVIRLVESFSGAARIGIRRPDCRVAWYEHDPERGVICLTSRVSA